MTEEEERIEMELRRQDRQRARQEEWEKIKSLGWGARIGYFWDYYKFVLVVLIFVIVSISIVRTMIIGSMTDMILEVSVLNTDTLASDAALLREDFVEYLGGLGKHEEIQIDTSVNVVENARSQADMMGDMKLTVFAAAGELDVCLAPENIMIYLQKKGMFRSWDDLLTEEQRSLWAPEFYMCPDPDQKALTDQALGTGGESEKDPQEEGPDSASAADSDEGDGKADSFKSQEHIYGIRVDENGILDNYIFYGEEPVYLCVVGNTRHEDTVRTFLEFMKGVPAGSAQEEQSEA
jgi:hypothetical protein